MGESAKYTCTEPDAALCESVCTLVVIVDAVLRMYLNVKWQINMYLFVLFAM